MACVTDLTSLSPDERKVLEVIKTETLSVEDIHEKTSLPIFRVRSIIRKLIDIDMALKSNKKYKAK